MGGPMGALRRQAVVLGASVGGLLAARVLADSFAGLTVVERDVLRGGAATRRGTPPALHPPALLTKGAHILDQLFPGLLGTLVDHGVQCTATIIGGPAPRNLTVPQPVQFTWDGSSWTQVSDFQA
jgi:hypothetical protein